MVKRLITVIVIAILLLTLGIVECVLVNNFIVSIDNQVNELIPLYTENKNDITILTEKANAIEKKWDDNEQILCLMFNHKDIGILTDTMTRLVEYTKQNYKILCILQPIMVWFFSAYSFKILISTIASS